MLTYATDADVCCTTVYCVRRGELALALARCRGLVRTLPLLPKPLPLLPNLPLLPKPLPLLPKPLPLQLALAQARRYGLVRSLPLRTKPLLQLAKPLPLQLALVLRLQAPRPLYYRFTRALLTLYLQARRRGLVRTLPLLTKAPPLLPTKKKIPLPLGAVP
jgi:hypothetical protein